MIPSYLIHGMTALLYLAITLRVKGWENFLMCYKTERINNDTPLQKERVDNVITLFKWKIF